MKKRHLPRDMARVCEYKYGCMYEPLVNWTVNESMSVGCVLVYQLHNPENF